MNFVEMDLTEDQCFVPNYGVGGSPRCRILQADAFSTRRLREMAFVEQRMNIKFCVRLGKSVMETYEMLKLVYDSDTLCLTQAFEWQRRFREDRESKCRRRRTLCTSTDFQHR
ncbi:hypothetical protein TNCV_2489111 [Trichonephila clavipes]|nr:hypothetical protein TNCV_2489111 [Trichonephila clavipes]